MASKTAIGKMTKDAINRIEASVERLVYRFGFERLDIASIRNRDPALERAHQLTHLADWLDMMNNQFEAADVDLTGISETSANLDLIVQVLDTSLNAMTTAQLKQLLVEDLNAPFSGHVKQEYVNEIERVLTGRVANPFDASDNDEGESG